MSAIAEVESAEELLGLRLPATVREWYSCDRAIEILHAHSNGDPPIPVAKFATIQAALGRLLPFRDENQGVCTWAVLLDGSEDPPVFVDVDSEGREWHMLAPTFSTYVWTCVWDYKVVRNAPRLVQGENGSLSSEAVDRLEQSLHAEPKTYGWPGSVQYRFSGDGFGC